MEIALLPSASVFYGWMAAMVLAVAHIVRFVLGFFLMESDSLFILRNIGSYYFCSILHTKVEKTTLNGVM